VWPKVRAFLESFRVGDVIADVGCGNGKYFGVRQDVAVLGSDRSIGLAEVAARRLAPEAGLQLTTVACLAAATHSLLVVKLLQQPAAAAFSRRYFDSLEQQYQASTPRCGLTCVQGIIRRQMWQSRTHLHCPTEPPAVTASCVLLCCITSPASQGGNGFCSSSVTSCAQVGPSQRADA
jgi:hypothetical protein